MEKEILILLIGKGLSQREIAKECKCSQGRIKHWLKKFNLKTSGVQFNVKHTATEKCCPICEETKQLEEFYSSHKRIAAYCKICSNDYHSERVKNVKLKMITYKGSCCEHCKLILENSHYAVFEFHHIDPKQKDPNFCRIKYQKWETIKKELDKCILLCANCHRLEHAKLAGW